MLRPILVVVAYLVGLFLTDRFAQYHGVDADRAGILGVLWPIALPAAFAAGVVLTAIRCLAMIWDGFVYWIWDTVLFPSNTVI